MSSLDEIELTAISDAPLDAQRVGDILRSVESNSSGAVVLFLGNVRDHHQGRSVKAITYTAYRSMAKQRLNKIVAELSAPDFAEGSANQGMTRKGGGKQDLTLAIHHRLGRLDVGETSVVIAASSPHREAAYTASRHALERLKAEVPIWKREHYADGASTWREEESLVEADHHAT